MTRALSTCLILSAAMVCAQGQSPCTRQQPVVTVTDRAGNPVTGLVASNFRAEVRGKPVKVIDAAPNSGWPTIILLLDASGSMTYDSDHRTKWMIALRAARAIVKAMPAEASARLILFASKIFAVHEGRGQILDLLGSLETNPPIFEKKDSRTALYDSIVEVIRRFNPTPSRNVLFVISDGIEDVHFNRWNQTQHALITAKLRLFSFMPVESAEPRSEEEEHGPQALTELVQSSGGTAVAVNTWASAEQAMLARQIAQISNFYLLDLAVSEDAPKPHRWKVDVVDAKGSHRKDVNVLYTREFQPCSENSGRDGPQRK